MAVGLSIYVLNPRKKCTISARDGLVPYASKRTQKESRRPEGATAVIFRLTEFNQTGR